MERVEVLSRTFNASATGLVRAKLLVIMQSGEHFEQELSWPEGIMPEVFEEMVRAVSVG